jgi:hypothetical protein
MKRSNKKSGENRRSEQQDLGPGLLGISVLCRRCREDEDLAFTGEEREESVRLESLPQDGESGFRLGQQTAPKSNGRTLGLPLFDLEDAKELPCEKILDAFRFPLLHDPSALYHCLNGWVKTFPDYSG